MTNGIFNKAMIAAAVVAVTMAGFSATASAQNRVTRSAAVQYVDLDLTSAEGQATLQGRIKGAVRKVCGSYYSRNLSEALDHRNCLEEANLSAKRATVTIMAAAATGKAVQTAMLISN